MTKQQKRLQREADIISATMELLEDRSFLELKMSDVANASECSMGAIYSHFSSKEDLLIGCTTLILQERIQLLSGILTSEKPALDKLAMTSFILWRENRLKPKHYQLQQFSWNASVWKRASEARLYTLKTLGESFEEDIQNLARATLKSSTRITVTDKQTTELHMGLFALTSGLFQLKETGLGIFKTAIGDDDGKDMLIDSIQHFLAGWGITPPDMARHLRLLNQEVCQLYPYQTH